MGQKTTGYTLEMAYDNLHNVTGKKQHVRQNGIQFDGVLKAGYELAYHYAGNPFQISTLGDENYRTEGDGANDLTKKEHRYEYDANGNLVYVNTAREKADGTQAEGVLERKLLWDEENRLEAIDDNGFVSNYWYDAAGERTVKTFGESEQIYVNSLFSGGNTGTADFTAYVNPYLVVSKGGQYTKHIYIGSQRVVSKLGDLDSYGADPRRIDYAGAGVAGADIDYDNKYLTSQQTIKDRYAKFGVPYFGKDNNDYVGGGAFGDRAASALARAMQRSLAENDNPELFQYYYHADHLGSSSLITDLDGETVQHIEYVPFGEVFIEQRNDVWNTPYLFNTKELDTETGLYYYGARYYDPRTSVWLSADPLAEDKSNISAYSYCLGNPIRFIDPDGMDEWEVNSKGYINKVAENTEKDIFHGIDIKGRRIKSVEFKAGTVTNAYSKKTDDGVDIEVLQVRGDDEGIRLFEFLADPTNFNEIIGENAEWSLIMTGLKGVFGLNFLTTSHNELMEEGGTDLMKNQLLHGYTIREHRHNHPSNSAYPSGLEKRNRDIRFADWITTKSKHKVIFRIFTANNKSYIEYNKDSKPDDFSAYPIPKIVLPEIIVTPKR